MLTKIVDNIQSLFQYKTYMIIAIIGYGHIATAIGQGLLRNTTYTLRVSAPSLPVSTAHPRCHTHSSNIAIIPGAQVLILAVKPIQMAAVLAEIREYLSPEILVISVAAGLALEWFEALLPKATPIVRAMPNIAAECSQSATPLLANACVSSSQKDIATAIFQSCGLITWTDDEANIAAFTALSGSGLAYLFLFTESMRQAGIALGLSEEVASAFTVQTLKGAASLASLPDKTLAGLQASVTSKGGTTAAALAVFTKHELSDVILAAMTAAYERSQSLLSKEP